MTVPVHIAAFGALNEGSYEAFAAGLARFSAMEGVPVELFVAGPYPNAAAVSAPGRPLRGEALQDEAKKRQLYEAVAADARAVGAAADILCMPCLSMVGFHDGVEKALGRPVLRLSDALAAHYAAAPALGVIHMRPAAQRIAEIFGDRAVTPDAGEAAALLAAEEAAKQAGDAAPVEAAMRELAEAWRDRGVPRILFARADAPKAHMGPAGEVEGVLIENYFDILAAAVAREAARRAEEKSQDRGSGAIDGV